MSGPERYGRRMRPGRRPGAEGVPGLDGWIALGVTVFTVSGAAIVGASQEEPNLTLGAAAVLAAQALPVGWRRRSPVAVWVAVVLAAAAYGLGPWPDPLLPLGPMVALATVVECCARRTAVALWLASAAATAAGLAITGDSDALDVWIAVVALVVAPLAGDWLRGRDALLARLRADADRAAADRRRAVDDARLAERTHLAHELHDVVAHHVAMMVVQAEAGAARAPDPGTEAAFDGVADTGRQALLELRRLLTILRTDPAGTAPQPGLDDVAALVDRVRAAGLVVDLDVHGERPVVAPSVALSAYRVVQEGLTNVVKHAGGGRARVSLAYRADGVDVAVVDDGPGRPPGRGGAPAPGPDDDEDDETPPGHGLVGLRERIALLDGELHAAPTPAGGYELRAHLPAR